MPSDRCIVCATDEETLLNIQSTYRHFRDQFEICKLDIFESEELSKKLCHKCTYEIDVCKKFIENIQTSKGQFKEAKRGSCGLCAAPQTEQSFFDLSQQKHGLNSFLTKHASLFNREYDINNAKKNLLCLSCRYCIDLLYDLRKIAEDVSNNLRNNETRLHIKTKTTIANRKNTLNQLPNLILNTPSDTDSETTSMAQSKRKVTKAKKNNLTIKKSGRTCDQCKSSVKNGDDMYKFHLSKKTICHQCWLTTDSAKIVKSKKKKTIYTEIKMCKIHLKDIVEEGKINYSNVDVTMDATQNDSKKTSRGSAKKSPAKLRPKIENYEDRENEDVIETHPKTMRKQRKHTENSVEEMEIDEVVQKRSTRNRKNSVKDTEETSEGEHEERQSLRSRRQKDTVHSIQDAQQYGNKSQIKTAKRAENPPRTLRNRKDSIQKLDEVETETKPTRSSTRARKDSDENDDINASESIKNETKKGKKSASKKVVKAASKRKRKEVSSEPEAAPSRKKGRSESVESTGIVRKSTRGKGKTSSASEMDEIIEIDEDSNSEKVNEVSDIESAHSGSSPSAFKIPHKKKQKVEKLNNVTPRISKNLEHTTSESEEIDVLKGGTDEESGSECRIDSHNKSKESISEDSNKLPEEDGNTTEESISVTADDKERESEVLDTEEISHNKLDNNSDADSEFVKETNSLESKENGQLQCFDEHNKTDDVNKVPTRRSKKENRIRFSDEVKIQDDCYENMVSSSEDNAEKSEPQKKRRKSQKFHDKDDELKETEGLQSSESTVKSRRSKTNIRRSQTVKKKNNKKAKNTTLDSDEDITESAISTPYICQVCSEEFDNKYLGLKHELSHTQAPILKLERVTVPEKIISEQELEPAGAIQDLSEKDLNGVTVESNDMNEVENINLENKTNPENQEMDKSNEVSEEMQQHKEKEVLQKVSDNESENYTEKTQSGEPKDNDEMDTKQNGNDNGNDEVECVGMSKVKQKSVTPERKSNRKANVKEVVDVEDIESDKNEEVTEELKDVEKIRSDKKSNRRKGNDKDLVVDLENENEDENEEEKDVSNENNVDKMSVEKSITNTVDVVDLEEVNSHSNKESKDIDISDKNINEKEIQPMEVSEEIANNCNEEAMECEVIEVNQDQSKEDEEDEVCNGSSTNDDKASETNCADDNLNKENPDDQLSEENVIEDEDMNRESLEELMHSKDLQVLDEVAESISDNEDEGSEREKELNSSSEKEIVSEANRKEVEEVRISDSDSNEAVYVNKSISEKANNENEECEIIQEEEEVEDVEQENSHHIGVHDEVEIESETSSNIPNVIEDGASVVNEVLTEVFNMAASRIARTHCPDLDPVSDFTSPSKGINKDIMPVLEPMNNDDSLDCRIEDES